MLNSAIVTILFRANTVLDDFRSLIFEGGVKNRFSSRGGCLGWAFVLARETAHTSLSCLYPTPSAEASLSLLCRKFLPARSSQSPSTRGFQSTASSPACFSQV